MDQNHDGICSRVRALGPQLTLVSTEPLVRVKLPKGVDVSASAVFTLAEACATAACLVAFGAADVACKRAEIDFRRPRTGELEAVGMVTATDAEACLRDLETSGLAEAHVVVEVLDVGAQSVATAQISFEIRRS